MILAFQISAFQNDAFQIPASESTVTPDIPEIRGGGLDHQAKRRKATLSDKPNQHLDQIIAKAFKTVFGELTDKKAPKKVAKQANKIVKEYAETYRPTFDEVDWFAFNQDLDAVQRLFALYQKEITDARLLEQQALEARRIFEQIENDNIEFLLMH